MKDNNTNTRPAPKKIYRVLYWLNGQVVRVVHNGKDKSVVRHHQSKNWTVHNSELLVATKAECDAYLTVL